MLTYRKRVYFCSYVEIFIIISLLFFLSSCAGLFVSVEKEEKPLEMDPVTEEYFREAMEAVEKKDISSALELLSKAHKREPGHPDIKKAINEVLSSIQIDSFYTPEVIQLGKALSNPLQVVVTYKTDTESYPVSDIPVVFSFEKGEGILTENAITSNLGIARCYVELITDYEKAVIIEARVDLPVGGDYLSRFNRRFIFSDRSVLDIPRAVVVYLDAESKALSDYAREILELAAQAYIKNGFTRVTPLFTQEEELFNRAFNLNRAALSILSAQADSQIVSMITVTGSI